MTEASARLDTGRDTAVFGSNAAFGQWESAPMADESTIHFVQRRVQELRAQIAAIRGQLAPLEAEYEKLEKIRAFLHDDGNNPLTQTEPAPAPILGDPQLVHKDAIRRHYSQMTIKELVAQAMLDKFVSGAKAEEIRKFIRNAYGQEIESGSLRPALLRMRRDSVMTFTQEKGWQLSEERRRHYKLYGPPANMKDSKLSDDSKSDDNKE